MFAGWKPAPPVRGAAGTFAKSVNPPAGDISENVKQVTNTKEHKDFVNSVFFVAKTNLDYPTNPVKTTLCALCVLCGR